MTDNITTATSSVMMPLTRSPTTAVVVSSRIGTTTDVSPTSVVPLKTIPKTPSSPLAIFNVNKKNLKKIILLNDNKTSSPRTSTDISTSSTETSTTTTTKSSTRHCTSLPLFYNASELCGIGARPGMECMPLRTPPGPYHYHVADQTKSLQELQNEVGALLEFRDLVIETFPDLKQKMASMSTTTTLTGMASSSSLASRREWEPGIRVKRKIAQKENNTDMSSTSLIRSRSNSHSGKKEPKSGEGNGSVVQDSGFSTETSSSKEAHSASSTTGAMQGTVASNRLPIDADDELLNLLDVIHRKSNRLRDEVEHLQTIKDKIRKNNINYSSSSNINNNNNCLNKSFQEHVDRLSKEDIQLLRKERDRLLDKLSEMEAETLAGRIKATKMQDQFNELCSVKKELEEQLKLALNQKLELNTRLHDLHKQTTKKSISSSDTTNYRHSNYNTSQEFQRQLSNVITTPTNQLNGNHNDNFSTILTRKSNTFSPVIIQKSNTLDMIPFHSDIKKIVKDDLETLGRLDGLVSSPNRVTKVRVLDSKKIAAILLETNVLELQRHLLTITVQNQVLTQRLEQTTKSKIFLMRTLDKSKEDIENMRFQLEEKDIELEGTKAQLRVLESRTPSKLDYCLETNRSSSTIMLSSRDSPITVTQISTPSMKAMIPLPMDEIQHHSSSTESAQDQTERDSSRNYNNNNSSSSGGYLLDTPKRRPSKIPLPGTKGYLAPKPPTGRSNNFGIQKSSSSSTSTIVANNCSTIVTNVKNLSRSTGNLFGKSGPSSVKRDLLQQHQQQQQQQTPSLNTRPESAHSLRKDSSSLGTNSRSSSSSIPISSSAKSTPSPHKISCSPLPKPKRDSLTSRVRHLDSLSRVHTTATTVTTSSTVTSSGSSGIINNNYNNHNNNNNNSNNNSNNNNMTSSATNLYKFNSNSKKDLSSSFTQGQLRDRKQTAQSGTVRRVSSVQIGRNSASSANNTGNNLDTQQHNETDSGKRNFNKNVEYLMDLFAIQQEQLKNQPQKELISKTITSQNRNVVTKSHDLIKEYMIKNCTPAILKPSYTPYEDVDETQLELAYKHPELLLNNENISTNNDNIRNYHQNDRNSIKLFNNIPSNISKTWEQLNISDYKNLHPNNKPNLLRSVSNNSDESEKLLFYQPVYENQSNFHVNKIIYSEDEDEDDDDVDVDSGDDFYDSIDDEHKTNNNNNNKNNISSSCIHLNNNKINNYDNIISICNEAGEDMAEINSFDRGKYCWSLESEYK